MTKISDSYRPVFDIVLMLTLLAPGIPARGQTRLSEPTPSNCIVRIDLFRPSGERIRHQFKTHLESRAQCATLARLHQPNFEPQRVSRKKVVYRWLK